MVGGDALAQLGRIDAALRFDENEAEQLPLLRGEGRGAGVGGVDNGLALERARDLAEPDDNGAVIVEFQCVADFQGNRLAAVIGNLGELVVRADFIDDDGLGAAKVFDPPNFSGRIRHHFRRPADERGIVEADHVAGLELAVLQAGADEALVKRHRPLDAGDAANAVKLRVLHRLDVVDELDFLVHHPDVGLAQIGDGAEGAGHQAAEDRGLLGDQQ